MIGSPRSRRIAGTPAVEEAAAMLVQLTAQPSGYLE